MNEGLVWTIVILIAVSCIVSIMNNNNKENMITQKMPKSRMQN